MSDNIPSEILHNIFCRLSAEHVIQFRGVCKSWRQIIDDPNFIKSYIKHQQVSPTSLGQLLVHNVVGNCMNFLSLSLDSLLNFNDYSQLLSTEATHVKNLIPPPGLPCFTRIRVPIESCNGLFLVTYSNITYETLLLWNPLFQEVYELPEYYCGDMQVHCRGFGYDCVNDDFKVVRIVRKYHPRNPQYKTLVYSLKYNSWKWIKDFPGCNDYQGVYLNGALYWISWGCIIALDLSTEDFRQFPLPFVNTELDKYREEKLDVLDGCLVLSCIYDTRQFDGWVMKDDRGNISWTTLFSFPKLAGSFGVFLRPVTYSKSNKHVLLLHNRQNLFWLDTEDNSAKKIPMNDLFRSLVCQVWHCSLFRIGNVIGCG